MTPEPKQRADVRIADDHVPPAARGSLTITVYCEDPATGVEAIVESDQSLLLHRGVSVAKTLRFKQRQSHVFVTNFTEEYEPSNKGAAIAFLEKTQEGRGVIAVAKF